MDAARDESGRGTGPRRVLVVEDDPGVRDFLVELLAVVRGIACGTAATFEEAVAKLRAREYHALVVDSRLRSGTGADLFRHLEAQGSPLCRRIVFTSGYLEEQDLEDICRRTGNSFVRKPFEQAEILPAIDRALARDADTGLFGTGAAAGAGPAEQEKPSR